MPHNDSLASSFYPNPATQQFAPQQTREEKLSELFKPQAPRPQQQEPHTQIAQYIQQASRFSGVDPSILAAVAYTESSYNPNARSPVGAIGYMQLLPETARALGVDPNDPMQNVVGGAKYLRQLYQQYGNWPSALAAYNGGGDAVKYLRRHGTLAGYGNNETYNYVNRIHALIQHGR